MASEVEICNMALRNLGLVQITSLDEARQEARDCKLYYSHVRDWVLRDHDWTFARKRRAMASFDIPDDYEGKYSYGYVLPADCLKPRAVYEEDGSDPQQYELWRSPTNEKMLLTDTTLAVLRYTMVVTDPTWFGVDFVEAGVQKLTAKLAIPLTKKAQFVQLYESLYKDASAKAIVADADEHDPLPELDETPWISARTTY